MDVYIALYGLNGRKLYNNIYLAAKEMQKLIVFKLIENKICWIQEIYVTCKTNCIVYS